jgi:hypothetical protein
MSQFSRCPSCGGFFQGTCERCGIIDGSPWRPIPKNQFNENYCRYAGHRSTVYTLSGEMCQICGELVDTSEEAKAWARVGNALAADGVTLPGLVSVAVAVNRA